ncbi:MAG: tRNA uracil 4-sulfurtransferase ThiI [Ignisphaera sp.]
MKERWLVLIRIGEVSLKGALSRKRMEKRLSKNIEDALATNNIMASVYVSRGRLWLCCFNDEEESLAASKILAYVMGVVSSSPVFKVSFNSFNELIDKALNFFRNRIQGKVFAVRARRVGQHNFTSKDVEKSLGYMLLQAGGAKVNLENPEYTAYVEIRGNSAYLYDKVIHGPGGLPIGVEGKVLSLFSGGIDSPVATWYALKRGCEVDLVLFNIGGEKHVWSVTMVAKALADRWMYGYRPKMYIIDIRPFIATIALSVPEEYIVVILRRTMNRIAERLAKRVNALALVTGESLGQVASQTLNNIYVIEEAIRIPILRPLIGMDKDEITSIARRIGTYEYSIKIEEYCTLGARTTTPRANLDKVKEYEARVGISEFDIDKVIDEAITIDLRSIDIRDIQMKLDSLGLSNIYRCSI